MKRGADMRVPNHIAIIPDGNRRWAKGKEMEKHMGYDFGLGPGLEAVCFAKKMGVEEITFYGFTTDNCNRPPMQFKAFSLACVKAVKLISKNGASLLVAGDSESEYFPKELLPYTTRKDINGGGVKLNFLVNYGWEWDLSGLNEGSRDRTKIMSQIKTSDISRIDLVVRWGGMRRLSGLLPVQAVYADFFVVDQLWPDYKDSHLEDAFKWYNQQDITLGG